MTHAAGAFSQVTKDEETALYRPSFARVRLAISPPVAMGLYLQTFDWAHFVTLTVERLIGRDGIVRLWDRFQRRIATLARRPVPYFFAIERAEQRLVSPHIHALVGSTDHLSVDVISEAWPSGFNCVRVYDPARGAAAYTSKGLLHNPDDYFFSRRIPRRRMDAEARVVRETLERAVPLWSDR